MKKVKKRLRSIARQFLPKTIFLEITMRRALAASRDTEIKFLPILAREGIFLDVGANVGSWSLAAAKSFREVHAFEPDVSYAKVLRRLLPRNVTIHPIALSNRTGIGHFKIPIASEEEVTSQASLEQNANTDFSRSVVREVKLAMLDGFNFQKVDAIKIDVEGHEAAVLEGAQRLISSERPALVIEIEERHHPGQSEKIIAELVSRDYVCCFIRFGKLEYYKAGSIKAIQPEGGHGGVGFKSDEYINNFLFFPKERGRDIESIERILAG